MDDRLRQFLIEGMRAGARYRLELPREAMRGAGGVHAGRMAGASLDFKDYRGYQPGDDLRTIDWNAYARSDRLIVKLFHEEISPHLDLMLDTSASMDLPGSEKARAFLGLAAVFAGAAANAGCTHAAWAVGDGFQPVVNGTREPDTWDDVRLGQALHATEALAILPPRWRRQGLRVFLSDLLWPGDPLQFLRPMADGAARAVVVQVLAAADFEPDLTGNTRLVDSETREALDALADGEMEKAYRTALAAHQQLWSDACRRVGATLVTLRAETIVVDWRAPALEQAQILGAV